MSTATTHHTYVAQYSTTAGATWCSTEHDTLGAARHALRGHYQTGDPCRVLRIPDSPETHLQSYDALLREGIAEVV